MMVNELSRARQHAGKYQSCSVTWTSNPPASRVPLHIHRRRSSSTDLDILAGPLVPGSVAGSYPVVPILFCNHCANAERIAASGAPVVQINTGKGCHLEAKAGASVEARRLFASLSPQTDEVVGLLNKLESEVAPK